MTDVTLVERVVASLTELAARQGVGAVADVFRELEHDFEGELPRPVLAGLHDATDRLDALSGCGIRAHRAPDAVECPSEAHAPGSVPLNRAASTDIRPSADTERGT